MIRRDFLRAVIGKPYKAGGVGPDDFDCYGLARHVLAGLFHVELPDSRFAPVARQQWRRLKLPCDGALIVMGSDSKHVGVYLAGGVLHALEGVGVIHDDLASLSLRGFGNLRAYRAHDQIDSRQARRL